MIYYLLYCFEPLQSFSAGSIYTSVWYLSISIKLIGFCIFFNKSFIRHLVVTNFSDFLVVTQKSIVTRKFSVNRMKWKFPQNSQKSRQINKKRNSCHGIASQAYFKGGITKLPSLCYFFFFLYTKFHWMFSYLEALYFSTIVSPPIKHYRLISVVFFHWNQK